MDNKKNTSTSTDTICNQKNQQEQEQEQEQQQQQQQQQENEEQKEQIDKQEDSMNDIITKAYIDTMDGCCNDSNDNDDESNDNDSSNDYLSDTISLPYSVMSNEKIFLSKYDYYYNTNKIVDIFGQSTACYHDEWTYIMPLSSIRATLWYPIVPWILPFPTNSPPTWKQSQRCIHGFTKRIINNNNNNIKKKKDDSDDSSNSSTTSTMNVTERLVLQENGRRQNNVGIKHFVTNRIIISNSKIYYEDYYANLLIVPILTPTQLTNWDGSGYSAIVLASSSSSSQGGGTTTRTDDIVSDIYQSIGSQKGGTEDNFLATLSEFHTAQSLLVQIILAFTKSCYEAYTNTEINIELVEAINKNEKWKAAYTTICQPNYKIPVPTIVTDDTSTIIIPNTDKVKIRKIIFRGWNDDNDSSSATASLLYPTAPDPTLLVTKAASTWLKSKGLELIP